MILDMASFFEFGSAYTALSRVRRMEDIKLVSYPVAIMEADMKNEFIYFWQMKMLPKFNDTNIFI